MRAFAAAAAGLLLAVAAAFAISALTGPDPVPEGRPLQVTSPPARP